MKHPNYILKLRNKSCHIEIDSYVLLSYPLKDENFELWDHYSLHTHKYRNLWFLHPLWGEPKLHHLLGFCDSGLGLKKIRSVIRLCFVYFVCFNCTLGLGCCLVQRITKDFQCLLKYLFRFNILVNRWV